jgi:hypothetical protein
MDFVFCCWLSVTALCVVALLLIAVRDFQRILPMPAPIVMSRDRAIFCGFTVLRFRQKDLELLRHNVSLTDPN